MQKRYCQCGQSVWVRYLLNAQLCISLFLDANGGEEKSLDRCPRCHRRLDINELG